MSETANINNPMNEPARGMQSDITISDKAADEIGKIKTENNIPENHFLRIGVKGGGCSGLSYMLAFEEEQRNGDILIEHKGVKVIVDERSLMYLQGTVLDYTDGLNGRGFVFNNPAATRTCGCGSSFGV